MSRLVIASVLAIAFVGTAIGIAQEKAEKKTLDGTLTCTKCALKETKACGHALLVKDGDKEVKYYIADNGGKEPYHKHCCTADVPAKVTGTISEKDGKKTISDAKVEVKN